MARLIRTTPKQCIYYDRGVGTDNIIDKLRGGIFGAGLYENVKQVVFQVPSVHINIFFINNIFS
jgi:uncharacterized protein (DUF2235 family)